MGLSIGKVTIDYMRDQSYPDGVVSLSSINVRENVRSDLLGIRV